MISSLLHEAVRLLARYENLALVVSALLGSAAIACAAFSLASILKKRSAKARGIVWRMAVVMLLVLGAWRLLPEMQEPVAVVQWAGLRAPCSTSWRTTAGMRTGSARCSARRKRRCVADWVPRSNSITADVSTIIWQPAWAFWRQRHA